MASFKGYVSATNMEDGPASHSFYMMLEGSADIVNWFCSLADNQKDTLQQIYDAFEERYGYYKKNSDPNFLLRFEERKQKSNEDVLDYIEAIRALALGTDLETHYLQSFIVKGLCPAIKLPVRESTKSSRFEGTNENRETSTRRD